MDELELDSLVALLAKRTFTSANVIEAVGITPDVLTTILSKVRPVLCTDNPGQGRARSFCLGDVYLIAILDALTKVTNKANWAANAMARFAFEDIEYEAAPPLMRRAAGRPWQRTLTQRKREYAEKRRKMATDITAAHELFWTRAGASGTKMWILFADRWMVDNAEYILRAATADKAAPELQHSLSGVYVNVSKLLERVDQRLIETIDAKVAEPVE